MNAQPQPAVPQEPVAEVTGNAENHGCVTNELFWHRKEPLPVGTKLYTAAPSQLVTDAWAAGVQSAADLLKHMAVELVTENGETDPLTGAVQFRSAATHEWYASLGELAEEIERLIPAHAPQEPMRSLTVPDDLPGMWDHADLSGGGTDAAPSQPVTFDQWNSSPYTKVLHETIKDLSQKLASMTQSQPVTQGEPVAWLDLSKMSASAMVYATGWKSNDKQSPLYTTPAPAPAVPQGAEMPLSMAQFGGLVGLAREHMVDNTFVYKATSSTGDTCHFGVESAAKAWAKGGTVEAIKVREFKLHTTPAAPSQEPAVNLSCKSTQARLAAQWGYVPAPSEPVTLTDEWVAVEDQKPPTNKPVLLHYLNERQRSKIVRAHYIPAKTVAAGEDDAAEEYDVESDTYFVQEGWYEDNSESEVNYGITGHITHWRHLPPVPAIIDALRGKSGGV